MVDTRLEKSAIACPPPFCFAKTKQRGVRGTRNDVKVLVYSVKEMPFGQGVFIDACEKQRVFWYVAKA